MLPKKGFLLSIIVLIGFFLVTSISKRQDKYYPVSTTSKTTLETSVSSSSATPSAETSVEAKKIAERVDYSRKLIKTDAASLSKLEAAVKASGGKVLKKDSNTLVADLPDDKINQVTQELQSSGLTKNLETDYPTYVSAEKIDWGVQKVEAEAVWPVNKGTGVKVAVVDTGMDYGHPDLNNSYIGGYDFVNKDSDPADDHGHGTHVSGTIASALDDQGLVGVAPEAKILAVKVLDKEGLGYLSDVISGINYAVAQGAQVINLSLGTTYDSTLLKEAVDGAVAKGVVVVAAAGNNSGGPLLYPAAYSSVISVAATDISNNLASFTALGAELSAPGVAITSTVPGGGYASWSGTSMAAPHVSAAAAMLISNKVTNVRQRLHETSTDLGSSGRDNSFGYGLIDLKTAFNNPDVTAPLVTILTPENNTKVRNTVNIKVEATDENGIKNVTLLLDNTSTLTTWDRSPYEYSWDYSGVRGKHEIVAKATDNSGNTGMAKITLTIQQPPPTKSLEPKPQFLDDSSESAQASPSSQFGKSLFNPNAIVNRQNFANKEESTSSAVTSPSATPSSSPSPSPSSSSEPTQTETSEDEDKSSIPTTTNLNQRNRKTSSDKRVKGLKTFSNP